MTDKLCELMPEYLAAGRSPDEFWGSSYIEIRDVLEAVNKVREREAKERISITVSLADLIWNRMSLLFSDKDGEKPPVLREWDVAPALFETEKARFEEAEAAKEAAEQSAKRRKYVAAMNEKLRKEGASK